MADPFLAEIRIVGFNFAPVGWAFCTGQLLPIAQNTALFSLLGTNYGGNGVNNFALPNLQDRFPMHWNDGPGLTPRFIGETGGTQNVTLLQSEMPSHGHGISGGVGTAVADPSNAALGPSPARPYAPGAGNATLAPTAAGFAGSSLPHNNMPPLLSMNFVIAMQGIFPSRS
jgi:microcystin-dependent protein